MRSLNLDQLRAFVEVVARGSFTAAAKELNLSQPAVTHQVHELEKRFQVTLIERLGKRAYLTPAGEQLLEHARQMIDGDIRTRDAMRQFDKEFGGRVRIGTSATVLMYALPSVLQKLKTERPHLEILLKAGLTAGTLRALKGNSLDLGICALPIGDDGFEVTPLFSDDLIAILPKSFPHIPKVVTPGYLAGCPLILGNQESVLRKDITQWLSRAGPPPKPVMTFDNVESIKSLVAVGLGASVVPALCLGPGHVPLTNAVVAPLNPRIRRVMALVKLRGKPATEAIEAVTNALMKLRKRQR